MRRRLFTMLGIAEVGALAILWRSMTAAPLVDDERDVEVTPRRRRDEVAGPSAQAV